MDTKRPTLRHIIIKMPEVKVKERILKAAREKKLVTYRGVPIRLSAGFSKEHIRLRELTPQNTLTDMVCDQPT